MLSSDATVSILLPLPQPEGELAWYCGKKTARQPTGLLKTPPVALPPLEYAGGVVAATTAAAGAPQPVAGPVPARQGAAPAGDLDLAVDAVLAAAAEQAGRRRWLRSGRGLR